MVKIMKLYNIWKRIKTRCFNKNNPGFKYYGDRGVTIHSQWVNNYFSFQEYVMNLPGFNLDNLNRKGITLDRIDTNKDYKPGNLRWVTMEIQARNRRKKSGKNIKSKYIGLSFDKSGVRKKRWRARISVNKKIISLGRFETEEEAKNTRNLYIKNNNLLGFNIN